jgi:hypothetical protein
MKTFMSLILVIILAGATYAGDMLQPAPPPPPAGITQSPMAGDTAEILVAIVQNLLLLR